MAVNNNSTLAVNYGSDLSCVSDIDPAAYEVSGRLLLGQALSRRLMTPRGRLLEDANYGFDLTQYVNSDLAPVDLAQIRAGIETECLKDERILGATANVQLINNVLIVNVILLDGVGPFPLVLSVTAVTTTILSVGQ